MGDYPRRYAAPDRAKRPMIEPDSARPREAHSRFLLAWGWRFMMKFHSSYLVRINDAGAREMPPPYQKVILLVDDDNEIIESMRTVLENKGYKVMVARDGNAGLTVAERENPDLIVLDMMMPKKSGFLVLEKLKGRSGGLIPTIMITGNEGSRHRAYAEMLAVRASIRNPFAMQN